MKNLLAKAVRNRQNLFLQIRLPLDPADKVKPVAARQAVTDEDL